MSSESLEYPDLADMSPISRNCALNDYYQKVENKNLQRLAQNSDKNNPEERPKKRSRKEPPTDTTDTDKIEVSEE